MHDVNVRNSGEIIQLGRRGENLARRILFDLTNWQALYGDGTVELIYQRPGEDTVYPVAITRINWKGVVKRAAVLLPCGRNCPTLTASASSRRLSPPAPPFPRGRRAGGMGFCMSP